MKPWFFNSAADQLRWHHWETRERLSAEELGLRMPRSTVACTSRPLSQSGLLPWLMRWASASLLFAASPWGGHLTVAWCEPADRLISLVLANTAPQFGQRSHWETPIKMVSEGGMAAIVDHAGAIFLGTNCD
jgi:hypothetical protein